MRHRMNSLGLGNPNKCVLENNWSEDEVFNNKLKGVLAIAIDTFKLFSDIGGVDFTIKDDKILLGYELAYQYEPYKVICIDFSDKTNSYMDSGIAWGPYGSKIVKKRVYYRDYKAKYCKFVKFIDYAYEELKK